jgi:hypothetical protein
MLSLDSAASARAAPTGQKIVDVVWLSARYLDGRIHGRRRQRSALTAPSGTSPAIMAPTCRTVSSD